MEILFVLIPVSLAMAAAFVAACLAAIRSGQFDDLESPRWRMLFDGAASAPGEAAAGDRAEAGRTTPMNPDPARPGARARRSDRT